jgi:hypothetical protein
MAQDGRQRSVRVNRGLIALNDAIIMLDKSILAIELALRNNPPPDEELRLRQTLADLRTRRDELSGLRRQVEDSGLVIPAPSNELVEEVKSLTRQVSQAAQAGVTSKARLDAASQGLTVASRIASHVRPDGRPKTDVA